MVLVKKWPFFHVFFLSNIGLEILFYNILERKNDFLAYKKKKIKKTKNWHFSKGVNAWFWSKNGQFSTFIFRQYRPEKCVLRYYTTKNFFLCYKNEKFKKSKNWHFSKQINPWFWSKNDHFSTFFFRQYSIGKCSLRYSTTRKRLSRL